MSGGINALQCKVVQINDGKVNERAELCDSHPRTETHSNIYHGCVGRLNEAGRSIPTAQD